MFGPLSVQELVIKKARQIVKWIKTLKIDGVTIDSRSHTHPSHSQTSRLLTSSLSLGIPGPRAT